METLKLLVAGASGLLGISYVSRILRQHKRMIKAKQKDIK